MLTEEQKKLVEENYKLVPYVIFSVMHLDDLEEWHGYACIGLCNAAVLWDKKKGPFAAYAVKAIKNSIIREINYNGRQSRKIDDENKLSLDYCYSEDGSVENETLQSIIPDKKNPDWGEIFGMRELIEMLDNREKRYILLLIKGYSFAEIAKSEGVSRQWVHACVQGARKKLKEWGAACG